MELLLTDDELVAVAVEQSKAWPTGLPTVDVESEQALFTAALRGRRSLAVRGLVGSEPADNELLDAVRRDAVGADGFVCLYIADQQGTRAADAVNLNAYRSGTGWLVETVSDVGVHQFASLTAEALGTLYRGLAQAAHDRGLAGGSADSLWIVAVTSDRRESISVRKGSVHRHNIGGDGTLDESRPATSDIGAEFERLLSQVEPLGSVG